MLPVAVIVLFDSGYVVSMIRACGRGDAATYIAVLKGLPFRSVILRHAAQRDADTGHRDRAADQLSVPGVVVVETVFAIRVRPHDAEAALFEDRADRGGTGRGVPGVVTNILGGLAASSIRASGLNDEHADRRRDPRVVAGVSRGRNSGIGAADRAPERIDAATVGIVVILAWVALALLAPLIAPYPPNANDMTALAHTTPSRAHWLGADHLRRDILSRILWGARPVLVIAPLAVLGAAALGALLGLAAGYYGRWIDLVITRACDIVLSFPVIILYMIILAHFGSSAWNIIGV